MRGACLPALLAVAAAREPSVVARAPLGKADWLYSSSLSPEFQAWAANASALVSTATGKYAQLYQIAAEGIANTSGAIGMVESELASIDAAGRPQSIDDDAGVLAAMKAMENAFTPEVAELNHQRIQLNILSAAYHSDFNDGEVLSRNGQLLLGQLTKLARQETNLEAEVESALQPAALLSRRAVRRADATAVTTEVTAANATAAADRTWAEAAAIAMVARGPDVLMSKAWALCTDYNYHDDNIYMHECHEEPNQIFFMDGEQIKSKYNDKCMDYNYNDGNVYMHDCHGGDNQKWYFDESDGTSGMIRTRWEDNACLVVALDYNLKMVDSARCGPSDNMMWHFGKPLLVNLESPMQVLRAIVDKLATRRAECQHHLEAQAKIDQAQATAESELVAQTSEALKRMQDTAAVLQEYSSYRQALSAADAEGTRLFMLERTLYAGEVEHVGGETADPAAAQASTAMRAVDKAHEFWMEWQTGVGAGFERVLKYLDTRHLQLEQQLASQEYLRPDQSPHLMWSKSGAPVGLDCPSDAEYADRKRKLEEAIAGLGSVHTGTEHQGAWATVPSGPKRT